MMRKMEFEEHEPLEEESQKNVDLNYQQKKLRSAGNSSFD